MKYLFILLLGTSIIYHSDIQIIISIFMVLNHRIIEAQKYKKTGHKGLFDEQETYQKLSSIGNPLDMMSKVIEFEIFTSNYK